MPPPTTRSRRGTTGNSSAPVEFTTRGSSGSIGNATGEEPAATMALAKVTSRVPPSCRATESVFGPVKCPMPRTTSTFRCRAIWASPSVRRRTVPALKVRSFSRSTVGAPK